MDNEGDLDGASIQAEDNSIAIGGISIGGNVGDIRVGHTIGYSAAQVSVLLTQIRSEFQPKPFDGRCPYKGLDVFEEEDAEFFFGRERLVEDLVSRVKDSRTLFITGPSGSGKSSLVRAGLIHALRTGALKHSERWLYETMNPGRDPIGELGRVASSLAGSTNAEDEIRAKAMADGTIFARWCEIALKDSRERRAIVFIDQFEEVFTQINKEGERVAFFNLLTHAATVEHGRVILLFAMRSDFVSNCATYPELNALLNQQFIQIGAMQPTELVSAIAQPALRVGLRIEPDLIAQIINDMKGEPGTLPLMEFALKELFDAGQARGGIIALTLSDYLEREGIQKMLARHADDTFARLSGHEQELTQSIFTGLIAIGRGIQDTKRTALFDELVPADASASEVESVVQKLANARLVTTDEVGGKHTVMISHEKLIDAWPWLKKLVNENSDAIALQNEIASDAKDWEDHKRDASYLYRGGRLVKIREQITAKRLILRGSAVQFVQASTARKRRDETYRISSIMAIISLTLGAILLFSSVRIENSRRLSEQSVRSLQTEQAIAGTAQASAEEAIRLANIASSRELAAIAQVKSQSQLDLALLLSVTAFGQDDNYLTRSALLDTLLAARNLNQFLFKHGHPVDSLAFSPNGKLLASIGCAAINGAYCEWYEVLLWDLEKQRTLGDPVTLPSSEGALTSDSVYSHFTPDGKFLDVGLLSGNFRLGISNLSLAELPYLASFDRMKISPDGTIIAVKETDQSLMLWDDSLHQAIRRLALPNPGRLVDFQFSPDGQSMISASCVGQSEDGDCLQSEIFFWAIASGEIVKSPDVVPGNVLALSPDGSIVALASKDRPILFMETSTSKELSVLEPDRSSDIRVIRFIPSTKMAALFMLDDSIVLWDVIQGTQIGRPLTGFSFNTAFSQDGKFLASVDGNNQVILWNVSNQNPLTQTLTDKKVSNYQAAFGPEGTLHVLESNRVFQWDVNAGISNGKPQTLPDEVNILDPNGRFVASVMENGNTTLFDIKTGRSLQKLLTDFKGMFAYFMVFSPDGHLMASANCAEEFCFFTDRLALWNIDTGQARSIGIPLATGSEDFTGLSFSPDGQVLAIGICYKRGAGQFCSDGGILLWGLNEDKILKEIRMGDNEVRGLAFNQAGTLLASGTSKGVIFLWDAQTGLPVGTPLVGHNSWVRHMAFSPDSGTLISTVWWDNIILWDVVRHQQIGQTINFGKNFEIGSLAFHPDGKSIVLGACTLEKGTCVQGSIILFDVDPELWAKKACSIAGRNFTRSEWAQYFPDQEYRKTCDQWPLEPEITPTP